MMVLVAYDVNTETPKGKKRLRHVAKLCENRGQRVQNSVFEGELTKAQLAKVKNGLLKILNETKDSVIIYIMRDAKCMQRETMGIDKGPTTNIL